MKHFEWLGEYGLRQVGGVFALGATSFSMLGGWDVALEFLIYLMITDYGTGFLAAFKKKSINSDVMLWGGVRKLGIIAVIVGANYGDLALNNGEPVFRNLAVWYYISREVVSVFENSAIIGIPWPPKAVELFTQLKDNTKPNPIDKVAKKLAKPGEVTQPISQQVDIVEEVKENKKAAE